MELKLRTVSDVRDTGEHCEFSVSQWMKVREMCATVYFKAVIMAIVADYGNTIGEQKFQTNKPTLLKIINFTIGQH